MRLSLPFFLAALCLLSACDRFDDLKSGQGMNGAERKFYDQAKSAERAGDSEKAIGLYRSAANASTGSVQAQLALGQLLREKGKGADAAAVLEEAVAKQPQNADALRGLGNAYIVAGDGTKALAAFDRALAIDMSDAKSLNGRGVALDLLGRHGEAQESFRKAKESQSGSVAYIENNLALSLIAEKKYGEAIPLLERLASEKDATPQIRQNLAMAYALSGDNAKARAWLLKDLTEAETNANLAFYAKLADTRNRAPAAKSKASAKPATKKKAVRN